jgi:hypothetical protein
VEYLAKIHLGAMGKMVLLFYLKLRRKARHAAGESELAPRIPSFTQCTTLIFAEF